MHSAIFGLKDKPKIAIRPPLSYRRVRDFNDWDSTMLARPSVVSTLKHSTSHQSQTVGEAVVTRVC